MVRIKEIDLEKAFGILLMIMGHQFYGDFFDKLIHGFHMPIFFIISGFLYKKKPSLLPCIKRKAQTLLVPYLFFGLFHLIALWVIKYNNFHDLLLFVKKYSYHIFLYNHSGMPICGAIWFLTALFFCELIYMMLDRLNILLLKCIGIFLVVLAGFGLSYSNVRLPYCVDVSLIGVGFFGIGQCLKFLFEKYKPTKNIGACLIGVFVASFLIMMNDSVNLRLATYGNQFLFYFNATLMAVSLFFVASYIKSYNGFVLNELYFIGQNSIVYLGFNQFVLIFLKRLNFDNAFASLAYKAVALLVCLLVLHFFTALLTKSKLKILIGK